MSGQGPHVPAATTTVALPAVLPTAVLQGREAEEGERRSRRQCRHGEPPRTRPRGRRRARRRERYLLIVWAGIRAATVAAATPMMPTGTRSKRRTSQARCRCPRGRSGWGARPARTAAPRTNPARVTMVPSRSPGGTGPGAAPPVQRRSAASCRGCEAGGGPRWQRRRRMTMPTTVKRTARSPNSSGLPSTILATGCVPSVFRSGSS